MARAQFQALLQVVRAKENDASTRHITIAIVSLLQQFDHYWQYSIVLYGAVSVSVFVFLPGTLPESFAMTRALANG